MKTKSIPAVIMLTAGLIACIAGIAAHMEVVRFTKMLLCVLFIFYVLGCVVKIVIDKNFKEMQEEETTDGKESAPEEEADEADKNAKEEKQ